MWTPRKLPIEAAESCAVVHALCDPRYWPSSEYEKLISHMEVVGCMSEAGQLCGFIVFQGIVECIDVVYICVHPLFRRRKIGKSLMEYMFRVYPSADVFIEVRQDNAEALNFYASLDFKPVNKRINYYKDKAGSVDAIVLKRKWI